MNFKTSNVNLIAVLVKKYKIVWIMVSSRGKSTLEFSESNVRHKATRPSLRILPHPVTADLWSEQTLHLEHSSNTARPYPGAKRTSCRRLSSLHSPLFVGWWKCLPVWAVRRAAVTPARASPSSLEPRASITLSRTEKMSDAHRCLSKQSRWHRAPLSAHTQIRCPHRPVLWRLSLLLKVHFSSC